MRFESKSSWLDKRFAIVYGIAVTFLSSSVYAEGMLPTEAEKLSEPIKLQQECKKIAIIEWKESLAYQNSSQNCSLAIQTIQKTCVKAVKYFPIFVKKYNFIPDKQDYSFTISLLPANIKRDGADKRNLNDIEGRFADRSKTYDDNGNPFPIWGYHQRAASHIYLRNDVLLDDGITPNPGFLMVFTHELFHGMSYTSGFFDMHEDKDLDDEMMADEFTVEMGLGK